MCRNRENRSWLRRLMVWVLTLSLIPTFIFATPAAAAGTTSVTITKYDAHGNVVSSLVVTWEQMRDHYMGLPVYGDGIIHYYCEGPNFDEARTFDSLWDPSETGNIDSRDYGAAIGTDVKDLCNLVGGAEPGYTIKTTASDNWSKVWDYDTIYDPNPLFGRIALTWYTADGAETGSGYVPTDYSTGMRLLFFTDIADATGRHVAGDYDSHQSLPENRWYYYYDGQWWPTTSGMSGKYINRIDIRPPTMVSCDASGNTKENFAPGETVYAKGQGLTASRNYKLWVQSEPAVWKASARGDTVPGATFPADMNSAMDPSGSQESVTTDASGDFNPVAIWTIPSSATPQKYDIVADNQAAGTVGTFDTNDGADSPGFEGFSVVELPPATTAAFTADVTSGTAPLTVHFTDQSTGSPTSWAWDFDNNGTVDSIAQNPSYVYASAGTYTVKLTATNAGGSDEETKTNYITVTSGGSQPAWDLNGDHVCNIGDVVKVGLQWGLTGASGWIPEDLNNDGVINIGDVVVLGLHWMQSW
ncbi:MAG: PKD domain-containing protein [Dehalococcoidia bacterium]|nr:PKD domain-containing protein [Dehalococcoidia bacterium]